MIAGIDLENIVYYRDNTHYFVMTAKKQSLLDKGVIIHVSVLFCYFVLNMPLSHSADIYSSAIVPHLPEGAKSQPWH